MSEARRQVGPGARIVGATKLRSGGIGGFFARERVEIEVEVPGDEAASEQDESQPRSRRGRTRASRAVDTSVEDHASGRGAGHPGLATDTLVADEPLVDLSEPLLDRTPPSALAEGDDTLRALLSQMLQERSESGIDAPRHPADGPPGHPVSPPPVPAKAAEEAPSQPDPAFAAVLTRIAAESGLLAPPDQASATEVADTLALAAEHSAAILGELNPQSAGASDGTGIYGLRDLRPRPAPAVSATTAASAMSSTPAAATRPELGPSSAPRATGVPVGPTPGAPWASAPSSGAAAPAPAAPGADVTASEPALEVSWDLELARLTAGLDPAGGDGAASPAEAHQAEPEAPNPNLVSVGLPSSWVSGLRASDVVAQPGLLETRLASLLPAVAQLPRSRASVIAVVGAAQPAMALAKTLAAEVGVAKEDIVVATQRKLWRQQAEPIVDPQAAADQRRSWRWRQTPIVVVVEQAVRPQASGWTRDILQALEPAACWGVAEASRKRDDIEAWSASLGGLDAVALTDLDGTASPAAALGGTVPVSRIDGQAADAAAWSKVIGARLEESE
jgi:hypothetical protein